MLEYGFERNAVFRTEINSEGVTQHGNIKSYDAQHLFMNSIYSFICCTTSLSKAMQPRSRRSY